MINNLRVHSKGLVLITIPLVFEIIFFALVFYFLGQAEYIAAEEASSRELIEEASDVYVSLYDLGNILAYSYLEKDPSKLKGFSDKSELVDRHFDKLMDLTRDKPDQRKHVEKMVSYKREMKNTLFGMGMRGITTGESVGSPRLYRRVIDSSYTPLLKEVKVIVGKEKVSLDEKMKELGRFNSSFRVALIIVLLASLFMTLFLVRLFSTGITWRLNRLTDNVERFRKRQPLNAPVSGNDEIRIVDQAFISMAAEVEALEKGKREFLSMISHDMRSPLTALKGTLAVATSGAYGDLNDYGKTRLENAEANVDRLVALINDLLEIDRLEAGSLELKLEELDGQDIVEDAMMALTASAETAKVDLINDCPSIFFTGDRQRVEQVLINLLGNAIKFSPENTTVRVSLEEEKDGLTFAVEDEGRGVTEESLAKIFDRYKQSKEEDATDRKGYGLGLAICKLIVEAHGGEIGAESRPEGGSRFWFRLPVDGTR